MSYDLTIKSDGTYSRSTSRAVLESFINQLPGVKPNGKHGFALDDKSKRWMEIDLEVVNEEGDNIESDKQVSADVNCIRLHIPYKFLGDDIERDYLPTAFAIAEHVGWTLYDDQDDEPVSKAEGTKAVSNAPAAFDRKHFIGDWISFPYPWGNAYMIYSISEEGRFGVTMIMDDGSQCSAQGKWDLIGDAIQWTYESCKGFPRPRKPELNKVLRVDENRLEILEKSGTETKFWRPVPSHTISATFTHAELRPFFESLIKLIDDGFATDEVDSLMKTANALGDVKRQPRLFKIMFRGVLSPLCIELSIGKNKTFRVTFSAPVALVEKIATALKAA
jgi:hypothetical protein